MFNGTMDDAAHVVFKYFSSKLNFLFVDFTFLESNTLVFTSLKLMISFIYIYVTLSLSIYIYIHAAKSLQSCPTLCNPLDGSPPAVLGFSRQEHWSGLPVPSLVHENEKRKLSCSVGPDC